MRDRETIDSELRRIALRRQSVHELGGLSLSQRVDELLDERLGHRAAASETAVPAKAKVQRSSVVLRRFVPIALFAVSLLAVAAVFATMFGRDNRHSAEVPDVPPPSTGQTQPAPPQAQAPGFDIADRVFIDVLNQGGVPLPSGEYATAHAHAVCGFLANQPDLAEAVRFVQQSSIWDADQSARVAAGAVVSYCPQYESASLQTQPGFQNSLADLQAVQRDLQAIEGDLQGIRDRLPALPGQ